MANELTYNFPLKQDAYTAFDAISLRNLIIQRLNDQGIITDQNYLGSNIASIIDIVSYAFNTLIFYLNKTSTEATFTEAQLYENINRIVKLLDYKPVGYQTSVLAFQAYTGLGLDRGVYTIPRYSYITVNSSVFSFNQDVSFTVSQSQVPNIELTDLSNKILLYQGSFRQYPIQIATGEKNEVVTVNTPTVLIDHFNLDVYVKEKAQDKWVQYKEVQTLYAQQAYSRSFEKRLNSNMLYEITFGDGIAGRRLDAGDEVAIFFLQSNGLEGVVGPQALNIRGGVNNSLVSTYRNSTYFEILADVNQDKYLYLSDIQLKTGLSFQNSVGSTVPKDAEDADSIRKNAPSLFKSQYRLVTQEDYETHIKTNFSSFISDVKVFSNWDYTGKYLKYFHDLNLNPGGFRQVILNQVMYADSCNFNNVYICAIPRVSEGSTLKYLLPAQKEAITSTVSVLKTLTTETTFLDPIYKAIHFGSTPNGEVTTIPESNFFYIEVQRHPTSQRALNAIHAEVTKIFKTFFDLTNSKLGTKFSYSSLYSELMSVNGVSKIYTKDSTSDASFEGLSFFIWNPIYPDLDKQTAYNDVNLLDFELLYFEGLSTIETKIVVV